MNHATNKSLSEALRNLLGESIASVIFVEDYVQVEMANGSRMTILEPLKIETKNEMIGGDHPSFKKSLQYCVGAVIRDVVVSEEMMLVRTSVDNVLRIVLSVPDATGETFIYQDAQGQMWVAGPAGA